MLSEMADVTPVVIVEIADESTANKSILEVTLSGLVEKPEDVLQTPCERQHTEDNGNVSRDCGGNAAGDS